MASAFVCDAPPMAPVCSVCSGPMPAKARGLTCGRPCAKSLSDSTRSSRAQARNARTCKVCGISFQPKRKAPGVYCSRSCHSKGQRKPPAPSAPKPEPAPKVKPSKPPRPCAECGTVFAPVLGDYRRAFCNQDCAKRNRRRIGKRRTRQAAVERVDPIAVFIRDGWRCQLCGCATPRRLRGSTNPRAPELDHILPLSQGGEHSYRNTHCACRSCNGLKASKPLGQTRLF